ncbi:MAG: hypothetical protein V4764_02150 [Burkholderia sp.]
MSTTLAWRDPRQDARSPTLPPADEVAGDGGRLVPFAAYLRAAAQPRPGAAHWPVAALDEARRRFVHGERGTAALVAGEAGAEVAPGISLAIQIVEPGTATQPHRHAFWHLYVVVSGAGTAWLGEAGARGAHEAPGAGAAAERERGYPLAAGDTLYVPPWAAHRFTAEPSGPAEPAHPLVLYAVQNLPQLAALGTLVREAAHGGIEHVYRAPDGAPPSSRSY